MPGRSNPTINAVIRISDVAVARAVLEAATGPLDRFEVSGSDGASYAQINAPAECGWSDVLALIDRAGPTLAEHAKRGEVGRPVLDIGFFVQDDRVSASLHVPNRVLEALGRFGFDLEASAYVASD